jgi:hypothetical protein
MKKMIVGTLLLASVLIFNRSEAQVRLNVNVNIGSQPVWGPVGYDYVDYYYLPDIETYYYVPTRQFIYLSGGNWIFSYGLPPAYRTYNLYSGYKVVVNQPRAYRYFTTHKVKYAGYRGNRSQVIIRNSDNPKYYVVKGHPKHKAKGNKGNSGRGNSKGKGRGNH